MWKQSRRFLAAVSLASLAAIARATPRPAVLELFTSEGCSSCPPAEVLVGELAQRRDVLPLSFHVDYWDDLGWRDPFSLAQATLRQRNYARVLGHASVYTPQAVIDGQIDVVGSSREPLFAAVAAPREGVVMSISVRDGEIEVSVGSQPRAAPADVMLVGYLRRAISHIGRGENSGRTLQETNIVRTLQALGVWHGEPQDFRRAANTLPKDVTDVAVLVQSRGQGLILGAVSQSLR
jgi:hypothetical protein